YVYNDQVCEEIFIVKVDIRKPKIDIVASSFFGDTVKTGDAVFVNAVISPLNSAYIYEWTPSDRVNPNNDRNAIATAAITEQVCLKVTDELGCSNTECVDIFVYEPFIKTPDAFSPNGDDRNDSFIPILSEDLKVVSFKVYDRWGDLVYATSENIAWDGTKNGKELPSDLYIWHIKTKQILSNVIFERQGNVSIVR
ncbi:MAG: T9SS type B sorting domain-containing protein, partial [Chitinophagales bacterium]